jgi:hypothetical protein
MTVWLQGYALGMDDFKMVVRTFIEVFPETHIWQGGGGDFILTGFNTDDTSRYGRSVQPRLKQAGALTIFARMDLPGTPVFLGGYRLGPSELQEFAGTGPVITRDRNTLEFTAPKTLYRSELGAIYSMLFELKERNYPEFIATNVPEDSELDINLGRYFLKRRLPSEAAWAFEHAPTLVQKTRPRLQPDGNGFYEGFEGEYSISLIPDVGFNDPDPDRNRAYRGAFLAWFSRISGIVPGTGKDEGRGLVVKAPEDIESAGYHVPVILKPAQGYQLTVSVHSDLPLGAGGGVSLTELKSQTGLGDNNVVVGTQPLTFIEGPSAGWREVTVNFQPGPDTRRGYLSFFQTGDPGKGRIVFDDITIAPE